MLQCKPLIVSFQSEASFPLYAINAQELVNAFESQDLNYGLVAAVYDFTS